MEKLFKTLLIIIAVLVGMVILSFVFDLFSTILDFIQHNETVILVVVAVISGLILLITDNELDPTIRAIAGVLLFTSVIGILGGFFGKLMENWIGSFFK
jgi:predicted tellurium resistance membrane protein TerC